MAGASESFGNYEGYNFIIQEWMKLLKTMHHRATFDSQTAILYVTIDSDSGKIIEISSDGKKQKTPGLTQLSVVWETKWVEAETQGIKYHEPIPTKVELHAIGEVPSEKAQANIAEALADAERYFAGG